VFPPRDVFRVLYKDVLSKVCQGGVIAFKESRDIILRTGFLSMVEKYFEEYAERSAQELLPSAEIHRGNLARYKACWANLHSSSTCLACLRRRPQYRLHCKHIICENCVLVFGESCKEDPWVFGIRQCLLCEEAMLEEVIVRTHPPTAGVGVLCIDGGGVRGVVPLKMLKRIQNQIGLPIPFQRFIKVAFGISSGTSAQQLRQPLANSRRGSHCRRYLS